VKDNEGRSDAFWRKEASTSGGRSEGEGEGRSDISSSEGSGEAR
jgi:hypothetical protein